MSIEHVLLQQARHQQLARLEELRLEFIGDANPPMLCAMCYDMADQCCCGFPMFWPLPAVLYKLRSELSA